MLMNWWAGRSNPARSSKTAGERSRSSGEIA